MNVIGLMTLTMFPASSCRLSSWIVAMLSLAVRTPRSFSLLRVFEMTSESCSAGDLKGRFTFTLATPQSASVEGIIDADGNGKLVGKAAGAFEDDSDCIVHIDLVAEKANKLRGIFVNSGKEILA